MTCPSGALVTKKASDQQLSDFPTKVDTSLAVNQNNAAVAAVGHTRKFLQFGLKLLSNELYGFSQICRWVNNSSDI